MDITEIDHINEEALPQDDREPDNSGSEKADRDGEREARQLEATDEADRGRGHSPETEVIASDALSRPCGDGEAGNEHGVKRRGDDVCAGQGKDKKRTLSVVRRPEDEGAGKGKKRVQSAVRRDTEMRGPHKSRSVATPARRPSNAG